MAANDENSCVSLQLLSNSASQPCLTPSSQLLADRCTHNVLNSKQQLHVVVVPYPVHGQINPTLNFAKLLTARPDADITVTIVLNKHHHDRLQRVMHIDTGAPSLDDAAARSDASRVQLTWVENGLPPDFDYSDLSGSNGLEYFFSVVRMKEPLQQLLQRLQQQSSPVSCALFGTFCPQTLYAVATELGIPTCLFWTQSVALLSIYYHLPLLVSNGFFPYNKKNVSECNGDHGVDTTDDQVTYIPGLPPLHPSSFPSLLQVDNLDDDSTTLAVLKEQISILGSCDGVIFSSFEELEQDASRALQEEIPCPVSLVGPLLPPAFLDGNDASDTSYTGASLLVEKSECIKWLDGKQKHSVLYIAFGSIFNPSADDLEGIALGIRSSKQPYLWVIRPNPSFQHVSEILPDSFAEDTRDHGMIITWAPQLQVLSHPSIGAFLTHCGWNSVLESLSMGIPMISLPIILDQPTNSTYVSDIWEAGVTLKRQTNGKVRSEDVEKAVRTVLHEKEGLKMRESARKLRDAARRAVQAHGSSYVHIEKFIQALRNHAAARNMYSSSS